MIRKQTVHVFDVDGTLTRSDTLLLLIEFERPSLRKRLGLILSVLPVVPAALSKNDMGVVKQALLKRLWKGKSREEIENIGKNLFAQQLWKDLRPTALAYIEKLRQTEPDAGLVLLSASCREWLQPLADMVRAELICTELEYDISDCFTGTFATPNCKGPEKVNRLLQQYPARDYEFICYANDESDKALQSISRQFFYRYF